MTLNKLQTTSCEEPCSPLRGSSVPRTAPVRSPPGTSLLPRHLCSPAQRPPRHLFLVVTTSQGLRVEGLSSVAPPSRHFLKLIRVFFQATILGVFLVFLELELPVTSEQTPSLQLRRQTCSPAAQRHLRGFLQLL